MSLKTNLLSANFVILSLPAIKAGNRRIFLYLKSKIPRSAQDDIWEVFKVFNGY